MLLGEQAKREAALAEASPRTQRGAGGGQGAGPIYSYYSQLRGEFAEPPCPDAGRINGIKNDV